MKEEVIIMTKVAPRKIKYCRISFDQSKRDDIMDGAYKPRPMFIKNTTDMEIQSYFYKTDIDNLCPGDLVVVPTNYKNNSDVEFKVGVFVKYDPIVGDINKQDIKDIIQPVDLQEYYHREQIKQERAEILAELEERKKAFEEENLYRLLAEKDPHMKALIERLNTLS